MKKVILFLFLFASISIRLYSWVNYANDFIIWDMALEGDQL
ncbi:MAG: hypothetical protein ACI8YQ_004055 [Polaribacter sp.]|jgi:hypothetical protein